MIPKSIANKVLTNLDSAAQRIEMLARQGKINPRLAASMVRDLDSFADKFEVSAFGRENLQRRQAALLSGDADEKHYMSTYDNPNKVLKSDPDEGYMHTAGPSARWDAIGTYDVDRSSTVSKRQEYSVVDQSEWSNGGKTVAQPSWSGGAKKHKASGPKTWAD